MEFIVHIVEHALEDTVALIPFLFITYLALEALEHAAGGRANDAVRRAGGAGPVVGALLGVVPQCGFSAMAATLYAGRVVTLGTLVRCSSQLPTRCCPCSSRSASTLGS